MHYYNHNRIKTVLKNHTPIDYLKRVLTNTVQYSFQDLGFISFLSSFFFLH
ncbi:IS3 family transposase [Lactobacillus helveticus]|uniref:IS3 family transposase n=1 Tax=Lactobacillus helveticus TaxID=1587 RepID=UPI003565E7DB